MATIVLDGWEAGLQKIPLTKTLQREFGLSLSRAKADVDKCLEGHRVILVVPAGKSAEEVARALRALGAKAFMQG